MLPDPGRGCGLSVLHPFPNAFHGLLVEKRRLSLKNRAEFEGKRVGIHKQCLTLAFNVTWPSRGRNITRHQVSRMAIFFFCDFLFIYFLRDFINIFLR